MGTNHRVLPRILGTMAAFTLLLAAAVACGEAAAPSEPAPPPTIVPMVQATPVPTSAPGAPAATTTTDGGATAHGYADIGPRTGQPFHYHGHVVLNRKASPFTVGAAAGSPTR